MSEENSKRTKCEVWTRVMGYHRPVSYYNHGKKAEHFSRQHFDEETTMLIKENKNFIEEFANGNA